MICQNATFINMTCNEEKGFINMTCNEKEDGNFSREKKFITMRCNAAKREIYKYEM